MKGIKKVIFKLKSPNAMLICGLCVLFIMIGSTVFLARDYYTDETQMMYSYAAYEGLTEGAVYGVTAYLADDSGNAVTETVYKEFTAADSIDVVELEFEVRIIYDEDDLHLAYDIEEITDEE